MITLASDSPFAKLLLPKSEKERLIREGYYDGPKKRPTYTNRGGRPRKAKAGQPAKGTQNLRKRPSNKYGTVIWCDFTDSRMFQLVLGLTTRQRGEILEWAAKQVAAKHLHNPPA